LNWSPGSSPNWLFPTIGTIIIPPEAKWLI
jgi:hypothetical protein